MGNCQKKSTISDQQGNGTLKDTTITVRLTGSDTTVPMARIMAPMDTIIMSPVIVNGIATDANIAYYTLSYRNIQENDYVEFYRNKTSINNGELGLFDPTQLINGVYQIRLTVFDQYNNCSRHDVQVTVLGNMKIGMFSLSFSDISTSLPGMTMEARRTYDSRDRNQGDFGYGWKLNLSNIRLYENRMQGCNWKIVTGSNGFTQIFRIESVFSHTVSIEIPGGKTQIFNVKPILYSQFNPTYGYISYEQKAGTYSKLEALDVTDFIVQGSELYDIQTGELISPTKYKLTFQDGTTYIFDQQAGGLQSGLDINGNSITLSNGGIFHSSGDSLRLFRDALNRITSIENGKQCVRYSYDKHGNLQKVIDPKGNITRFKYAQNHYLTEIIDPRGTSAIRTEYDDDGRMIRQISPSGDTMHFYHDLNNNREVTRDFNGNETEYTYDNRGNVLTKTDAAANTWEYTYDSLDNLLTTKNPDGTVRSSTWDDKGNELTTTDERGYTTNRTFNSRGQILTETDPLNRTTSYIYDSKGNLLQTVGPDGKIIEEKTYASNGNELTEKDAEGNLTQYGYDSKGRMASRIDPLGRKTEYILDGRGNTIAEVDADGDTTRYGYDLNDNQIISITVNKDTISSVYNVFNKIAKQFDVRGNMTIFEYDIFGQLKKTIAPDSSFTQKSYNAQGNLLETIDEMGRTTSFEYDHENRITKTIYNDGSFSGMEYDSHGRRTASIDRNGNRTEYEYDEVGNNTVVRDPANGTGALGNETTYEYDAVNRRTVMVDALGQRTEYTYDDYDRLIRTTFADGSYIQTEYDAAGRKTAEIDQEGKRTEFAYDAVGNLTSVTDAMGYITSYTYDDNNNRITQTDANSHTTTLEYDVLNRLTKRTYPNGDQERFGFDANGNMTYKVSGIDSTAFTYDSRNRETYRWYSNSGHTVETKYTADSKKDTVIDHRGITDYDYNTDGRLEVVTNPDNTFIQYAYDSNGNKTEMTTPWGTTQYSFDQLNRMKTVTSPDYEVTEYFYNAVGKRDSISHANGTSVGYDYDNLNRLTNVTNYAPDASVISSFKYDLNNAGIRTAVTEADGSRVDYGYDDLYRLTGETRTGIHAYSIAYTYDNVGNRLTKDHDGVVTNYVYNNRDQLTSETSASEAITYAYDASGRMVEKVDQSNGLNYTWIDNDMLASVSGSTTSLSYTYNAEGIKVSCSNYGNQKNYLIDAVQPYAQVIGEYDNVGNPTAEYVFGLERISQNRGGSVHIYLADGQGSIRVLTDASGIVTDTYEYYAFGEELARTGVTENNFKFVGEEIDPNSGFSYNRARWYNMSTGRFMSVDQFAGIHFLPMSLNRYMYGNQNPANAIDPDGNMTLVGTLIVPTIQDIIYASMITAMTTAIAFDFVKPTERTDKSRRGTMRIQLQQGLYKTFPVTEVIENRDPPGVMLVQFRAALWNFFFKAQSEIPSRLESNLLSAVIQTSVWAGTVPPNGVFGVKTTVHQEYFPLNSKKEPYRIDVENRRGHNLRF